MRHSIATFLLVFILLPGSGFAQAQSAANRMHLAIAPNYGVLMPHHSSMQYLVAGHIPALEAEISFQTDGSRPWHHFYNFPSWGVDAVVYDLRSPYLGYAASARMFYDLPLDKARMLGLKMGLGLAWVQKPFDAKDNYHNPAIGSAVNASLGLTIHGNLNVGERWQIMPGLGIHHFSNGAYKVPNAGINLAMLSVMARYNAGNFHPPTRTSSDFKPADAQWFGGISAGVKEIYPVGGRKYGVLNAFALLQKRVSHKSTFGGELGLNYNSSLANRKEENNETGDPSDNYRIYLAGLYQLHFDPIAIRFEVGSYLFPNFTYDGLIFFRYHILYNLEHFQIFAGLKSHFARADNCELGIAYRLK